MFKTKNAINKIIGRKPRRDCRSKNSSSGSDYVVKWKEIKQPSGGSININLRGVSSDEDGHSEKDWPSYHLEIFEWGKTDKVVGRFNSYSQAVRAFEQLVNRYKR